VCYGNGTCDDGLSCLSDVCVKVPEPDVTDESAQSDVVESADSAPENEQVEPCESHCDGRECGGDGCGGTCGSCSDGTTCQAGACHQPMTDNGDGTLTAAATDLVWQKTPSYSVFKMCSDPQAAIYRYDYTTCPVDFREAENHCKVNVDGLPGAGWRLPTISELRSLVRGCPATVTDGTCRVIDSCVVDSCFTDVCFGCALRTGECRWDPGLGGDCSSSWFWSSIPVTDAPANAWGVAFDTGQINRGAVDQDGAVRCVRSRL
jgi:hypothetical protein